jgi:hypothetical protein
MVPESVPLIQPGLKNKADNGFDFPQSVFLGVAVGRQRREFSHTSDKLAVILRPADAAKIVFDRWRSRLFTFLCRNLGCYNHLS